MALFGRKKKDREIDADLLDDELLDDDVLDDELAGGADPATIRPTPEDGEPGVDRPWDRAGDGPYDISEWPDLSGRIDLGTLRLPAVAGMQMRLDLEQGSNKVVGATMGFGASQAQVQVFAAPRTLGLWDELRPDIVRGLVDAGGAAEVVDGVLGKEIQARMPGRAPDGRVAFQPARFFGIDGPRWFIRVVVNGPAAQDEAQLAPILAFIRMIVVKRGDEPRPPREVLELTPPAGVMEQAAEQARNRREQAARAAAAKVAAQAPSLQKPDATGVAGIAPGGAAPATSAGPGAQAPAAPGQPAGGRHRQADPPHADAPKAPSNPEFT